MASEVRVAILGDSRDFSRAVRDARNDADRLDGSFTRVREGAARMSRAIGLAAVGGIAIGAHAVRGFLEAAEESRRVTRQTEAVIRSMGNASNISAAQVGRMSARLAFMSGIDDELIQSGANVLLTFGQVRNEIGEGNNVFDRATEAALNMSVALGTDLNSAAMMVGKALNDPIRGLTALRRSGVQFTREQEDQIRAMVEAGDVMGAQRVMLRELERQFGGSAEAQATASDRLRVAWGNLQEQIGEILLPKFEAMANWLTAHLPAAFEFAGDVLGDMTQKWEDFTTAVFGVEDWDSFWADVSAGWIEAQRLWDDFVADLKRGWEEFKGSVLDGDAWRDYWANVVAGWHEVQARWDEFTGNLARGWDEFISEVAEVTGPFIRSLEWMLEVIGRISRGLDRLFGEDESIKDLSDALNGVNPNLNPNAKPPMGGPVPFGGPFDSGGVVPGPTGAPRMILAHGGETILPTHKSGMGGVTQIFYGEPDEFIMRVADKAGVRSASAVRRDLNWSV